MEQVNYRCGWCGQYTDNDGNPIGIPDENDINLKEQLTYGMCCVYLIMEERQQEEREFHNRMNESYLNGEL